MDENKLGEWNYSIYVKGVGVASRTFTVEKEDYTANAAISEDATTIVKGLSSKVYNKLTGKKVYTLAEAQAEVGAFDYYVEVATLNDLSAVESITIGSQEFDANQQIKLSVGMSSHLQAPVYKVEGNKLYVAATVVVFETTADTTIKINEKELELAMTPTTSTLNAELKSMSEGKNSVEANGTGADVTVRKANEMILAEYTGAEGTDVVLTKKVIDGELNGYGLTGLDYGCIGIYVVNYVNNGDVASVNRDVYEGNWEYSAYVVNKGIINTTFTVTVEDYTAEKNVATVASGAIDELTTTVYNKLTGKKNYTVAEAEAELNTTINYYVPVVGLNNLTEIAKIKVGETEYLKGAKVPVSVGNDSKLNDEVFKVIDGKLCVAAPVLVFETTASSSITINDQVITLKMTPATETLDMTLSNVEGGKNIVDGTQVVLGSANEYIRASYTGIADDDVVLTRKYINNKLNGYGLTKLEEGTLNIYVANYVQSGDLSQVNPAFDNADWTYDIYVAEKGVGTIDFNVIVEKHVTTAEELQNALFADHGYVVLDADVVVTNATYGLYVIESVITLDLNGHSITADAAIANVEATPEDKLKALINVWGDAELTIVGEGMINSQEAKLHGIIAWETTSKVIINGGTIMGDDHAVYAKDGSVEINGGFFSALENTIHNDNRYLLNLYDQSETASIVVRGGVFDNYDPSHSLSENPEANFVAEGYNVFCYESTYIVGEEKHVSTIDELQAALESDIAYIILDGDITVTKEQTSGITVENCVAVIDLNGHSIVAEEAVKELPASTLISLINVRENGTLAIIGEGTIDSSAAEKYAVSVWDKNGSVLIQGGDIKGSGSAVYAKEGFVEITGGNFSNTPPAPGYEDKLLNLYDKAESAYILVRGGTFKNFDPSKTSESEPNLLANGYEVVENEGVYTVVKSTENTENA